MDARRLEKEIREALGQRRCGLLIWYNEDMWERHYREYSPMVDKRKYNEILDCIFEGKMCEVCVKDNGKDARAFLAVPVWKLKRNEDFFNKTLKICQENGYEGPIEVVPI